MFQFFISLLDEDDGGKKGPLALLFNKKNQDD